ncbi:MAG: signal recognition particle-docking protein FtsY [Bdellovibrionales bacterium]
MIGKSGWLGRLRQGLVRSSSKVTESISAAFTKRKLDDEALSELEDILIMADLGPSTAAKLVAEFGKARFGKEVTDQEIKEAFAAQIAALLEPCAVPLVLDETAKPFVVLMVGVNGAGKTTTIGKMAKHYVEEGKKVLLAAGDTFRAAAVEQLCRWGERAGCPVITGETGSDAAALAYRAVERARAERADILFIDTAGRLQNKKDLMEELAKIVRVIKKQIPEAPHATLLVLDATTGQNAHAQVEVFKELTEVSGLVLTKLDGSAKGGVMVALADRFQMPIHAVGVGESAEDLQPFNAKDFAEGLMGMG